MTRIERRVLRSSAVVGLLLTTLVLLADQFGVLRQTENWLYDLRARSFQNFVAAPTDRLVHLDIDDRALEAIGAWPWPRARLAEILDELRLAGAKALAMDVLFTEPQPPTYDVVDSPAGGQAVRRVIDNDRLFADALARLGNGIVPASLDFETRDPSPLRERLVTLLAEDPARTEADLLALLEAPETEAAAALLATAFLPLRREAVQRRVSEELSREDLSPEALRRRLLPGERADDASPLSRLVAEQAERFRATAAIRRFTADPPKGLAEPLLPARVLLVPIEPLGRAAAASGFVDYRVSEDGVLRSVPLLVEVEGRVYPQMGLSLAMMLLGTDVSQLTVRDDRVFVPRPDGTRIEVPVRTAWSASLGRNVPMVLDIPWFGTDEWANLYDFPAHATAKNHLSINAAWEPVNTRRKIAANNEIASDAVKLLLFVSGSPKLDAIEQSAPPPEDDAAWATLIDETLAYVKPTLDPLRGRERSSLSDDDRMPLDAADALARVRQQNPLLQAQLLEQRRALQSQLQGRAVLMGWVATGRQDVTPTSVHPACPGVIAHGVIFNALMTGDFWTTLPPWVTTLLTVVLGLATAAAAGWFAPAKATIVAVLLGAGYALVNGLVLFDANNLLAGLAAPLTAVALVWAGCSIARVLIESSERARVTKRFRAYVDPTLVNYVIERPDQVRLEGETRELTVVFTDLAGFTTLSERLGDKTVPLLNQFMGAMVPIIRGQRGYVNKFLGDGIMFFFGAPVENPAHAPDAVAASLKMQQAIRPFNEDLYRRDLPPVSMRVGVSSGMMVVGDAGSADASDYTVLGDTVNLGARLESANKATGTAILLNARAAELAGDRFLLRAVGKLQVAGKTEGVMTYEAMAFAAEADDRQRLLKALTDAMVHPFLHGDFHGSLAAAERLEREFGLSKLASLYRRQCQMHIDTPPGDGFDGTIVLTEK
jgi:class 3 adenylate cyclase/CHASE2 domain-containing sensor protein